MLAYFSEFFSLIKLFVNFLISLQFLPGVSVGSMILYSLVLFVIVSNIWVRR